jgi:hypothetical protein
MTGAAVRRLCCPRAYQRAMPRQVPDRRGIVLREAASQFITDTSDYGLACTLRPVGRA